MKPPITGGSSPGTTTTHQPRETSGASPHKKNNTKALTSPSHDHSRTPSTYATSDCSETPRNTIVYGPITITASVTVTNTSVARVEFYIDGKLKKSDDTAPYTYRWAPLRSFKHTIMVKAYDADQGISPSIKSRSSNGDFTQSSSSAEHTSCQKLMK